MGAGLSFLVAPSCGVAEPILRNCGIFRFFRNADSQKKDVPDLSSDTKSCNVKGQLQAVVCIQATSSKSSNAIKKRL